MPRIDPLEPPFGEAAQVLSEMMPAGVEPIVLFRTFARNLPMTQAMRGWGSYELSKNLTLSMRDREIVIDRTCALSGCEYEWGVHIVFFASRVALSPAQVTSLTHGSDEDPCWDSPRDRLLLQATDELHHTNTISDGLYERLHGEFSEAQLLDLALLAGWYHAISYAARVADVDLEPWAPTFASVTG